jgi:sensor domain CHASE-containing protein/signal transduction histidine kinase
MKLQSKTILLVTAVMTVVIIALWLITRIVLMSGFSKVEQYDTERNVKRMLEAINEMADNLSVKAADWSKWDDTYHFVIDRNSEYIESNLTDESLAELKLNLMIFLDSNSNFIFSRNYDLEKNTATELSDSIKQLFLENKKITEHQSKESIISGLYLLENKPVLIVSRPILTSSGDGPIHGTIIFGKYFDSQTVSHLQKITHLNITILPLNKTPEILSNKATIDSIIQIMPIDNDHIAGYTFIRDFNNEPLLIGQVIIQRDIYKQGQLTKVYLIVSIIIAGLIIGLAIILLLQKTVLSRIARLNNEVNTIRKSQDNCLRVTVDGKDELALFASSVNSMLGSLESKDIEVRKRNAEMRLLMNTIPTGVLSINEYFRINPEYSKSAEFILEKQNLNGQTIPEVFGLSSQPSEAKKMIDFLSIFHQELIPEKDAAALNPFEEFKYTLDENNKWIRSKVFLINRGENRPKHILILLEDITEEKQMAERIQKSERENLQLKAIAEDPDLFKEFLTEMKQILNHAENHLDRLSNDHSSIATINEIFRDVHTIKGTAGSFGLTVVVEIAGVLEERLCQLRDSGTINDDIIRMTRDSLSQLSKAIMDIMETAKLLFGEDFGENSDIFLRISLEKIKREFAALESLISTELIGLHKHNEIKQKIEMRFQALRAIPAKRGLAKAFKIVPGLLKKLEKNILFEIEGSDVPIDCEIARELNTPLIHIIRNCFDHGIEQPEERVLLGKPEQGHVKVLIKKISDLITIEITDDGQGIQPEKIKAAAIKKGFITEKDAMLLSPNEIINLIFQPGLTTAETVTDISGRGIGMDAVISSVKENLKGNIAVSSTPGEGSTFTIQIPCCQKIISNYFQSL